MATEQKRFMLLVRGGESDREMSSSDYLAVIQKYQAWVNELRDRGYYLSGDPLEEEGATLSGKGGSVVTDGPFAESKEAVGGYFLIQTSGLDQAVEIAKGCPVFDANGTIEVRPVQEVPE
jgi:hypothetical protein